MGKYFTNYELALLAKEKGFDEVCSAYFTIDGEFINCVPGTAHWEIETVPSKECSAPLVVHIIDWFERIHKLKIRNIPYTSGKDKWVIWRWEPIAVDNGYWREVKQIPDNNLAKAFEEAFKFIP